MDAKDSLCDEFCDGFGGLDISAFSIQSTDLIKAHLMPCKGS